MLDLVIRNGNVVIPHVGVIHADLGVRDGRVAAIAASITEPTDRELDATGLHIFPGVVDPHVHIGNYFPFADDLRAESRSAAHGGVTTLITTLRAGSFDDPPRPYSELLPDVLPMLADTSQVDFAIRLTLSAASGIDDVITSAKEFGVGSVKFYTAYKDRPIDPGISHDVVLRFLQRLRGEAPGVLPMVHAESDEVVRVATEQARAAGLTGLRAWLDARPNFAEALAIREMCELSRYAGCPLYIVHVSTAEGAMIVADAQSSGARIIGETCAHYLTLTADAPGTIGKVNPPLREGADVTELWRHIRLGTLTAVGSDHVARPTETKRGDIWEASLAFPGMETLLPLMITECLSRGLPLNRVSELCSWNPSRIFGLARKGNVAVGYDADLVLVDLAASKAIHADELHSQAQHTPYEGMTVRGLPITTLVRGNVVASEGQLVDPPQGTYQRAELEAIA